METIEINRKVQEYLSLDTRPVGIKLFYQGMLPLLDTGAIDQTDPRSFCRYVHEAASGADLMISGDSLSCPNAQVALGFRQSRFTSVEPRIKDHVAAISIGPLEEADVVMLIVNAEQAMTLSNILTGLDVSFKRNRTVCGEGVARVMLDGKSILSFLCIGARTKGEFKADELLVSVPAKVFQELPVRMSKFASLGRQAKDGLAQQLLKIR